MHVKDIRRIDGPPSAKGFRVLARFNIQFDEGVCLFDFELVRAPNGAWLIYSQPGRGGQVAAVAPSARSLIISQLTDYFAENIADAELAIA